MKSELDVSIIVLSYNTKGLTCACIKSVVKYTKNIKYELIIVDNASSDGSEKVLEGLRLSKTNFHLIKSKQNLGFSGGNNLGLNKAKGRYILLLNSDTEFNEDSLLKMILWMDKNPKVGVATCKLRNPDGTIQANGGYSPGLVPLFLWATFLDDVPLLSRLVGPYHLHAKTIFGENGAYGKAHKQDWASGAFMFIRRQAYNQVGGFDTNFFMYAEDVEYCYRYRKAGWEVWYVPVTDILHIGSASSGGDHVKFMGSSIGKERGVVGEFSGIRLFYKKHLPEQYWIARLILKTGAALRFLVFGFLLGQTQARGIYAKAFQTI